MENPFGIYDTLCETWFALSYKERITVPLRNFLQTYLDKNTLDCIVAMCDECKCCARHLQNRLHITDSIKIPNEGCNCMCRHILRNLTQSRKRKFTSEDTL